ncbi:MAG: rod shape-determining protein MreD [Eggerthella lenta]
MLLQITVAPSITLFEAVPNFIVAFCIVRAIITPASSGSVMPLVMGLLFDLMGSDYGCSGLCARAGNVSGLAAVHGSTTYCSCRWPSCWRASSLQVMYGLIVVVCGAVRRRVLYRTLPCMLYDCVIGLLLYPIAARLMVDRPRVNQDAGRPPLGRGAVLVAIIVAVLAAVIVIVAWRQPRAARPQNALGRPHQGGLGAPPWAWEARPSSAVQGPGRPQARRHRGQLERGRVEEAL